jgi:hypothetical protein
VVEEVMAVAVDMEADTEEEGMEEVVTDGVIMAMEDGIDTVMGDGVMEDGAMVGPIMAMVMGGDGRIITVTAMVGLTTAIIATTTMMITTCQDTAPQSFNMMEDQIEINENKSILQIKKFITIKILVAVKKAALQQA